MSQFNIADAKAHLSELVKKAMLGEEVIIAKDNKPLLRLVPIAPTQTERTPGSAKGQILHIAEDFDAPLDDFADYR